MNEIANTDYKIIYLQQSAATPNPNPTAIEVTSIKNKCGAGSPNWQEILTTQLSLIQTSCTLLGYTFVSGFAIIQPTAIKCSCQNQLPLRKDDFAQCTGTFTSNSDGSILQCSCRVSINDAGQNKVSGN